MLPHNYGDLFSYQFEGATLGFQFEYLPHSGYCQPSGDFSLFAPKFAIFAKFCHFRRNRQFRQKGSGDFSPFFAKLVVFAKIAKAPLFKGPLLPSNLNRQPSGDFSLFSPSKFDIFAKIATLQGATFGIQFESPASWRFFAIFAIACISGHKCLVLVLLRNIRLLTAQVATVNLVEMITNGSKKQPSNKNSYRPR